MKKVSVIVPVFNDEKYIDKAISSVLNQTYENIEVVLVDDGSTDQSGSICDDYAVKYANVQSYHKDNGGASSARNLALKKASGDYITFLDGDDWLDTDFIQTLVDELESSGADICVGNYRRIFTDGREVLPYQKFKVTTDSTNAFIEIMKKEHCAWELCSKLYRQELFDDFSFDEDIQICEDLLSNWYLFRKAHLIRFCGACGYNYLYRADSITKEGDIRNKTEYLVFYRIYQECFDCEESVRKQIRELCIREELSYTDDALHNVDIWGEEYFEKVAGIAKEMNGLQNDHKVYDGYEYLKYPVKNIVGIYKSKRHEFLNDIRKYVNSHDRAYIYGHGKVAAKAESYMQQNDIHFDGHMVTKKKDTESKNVIEFDSDQIVGNHIGIITGIGRKILPEVRKLFFENNISDFMAVDWNAWWLR